MWQKQIKYAKSQLLPRERALKGKGIELLRLDKRYRTLSHNNSKVKKKGRALLSRSRPKSQKEMPQIPCKVISKLT